MGNSTIFKLLSKLCLLSIIAILLPKFSYPQYPSINTISTELVKIEKGLSQNSVRCILKDNQGFMWFGTWDGLNRYDGIDFRIFSYNLEEPDKGLASQTANCILQDSSDFIWVGTLGGVNIINPKTFEIEHIHRSDGLIGDTILSMFLYKNKYIWVGTNNGIQIIHTETKKVHNFNTLFHTPEFNKKEIRSMYAQNANTIWIGTNHGLYKLNISNGKLKHYTTKTDISISSNLVTSLESYKDSLVFIGTENGFNIFNLEGKTVQQFNSEDYISELGNNAVLSLMLDHTNKLWIGTSGGGVSTLKIKSTETSDPELGVIKKLNVQFNDAHKLKANIDQQYIHCLYESDDQIVWIGTAWNGVVQLNSKPQLFKHFYKFSGRSNRSSAGRNVWAIMEANNEIWIGTENGVQRYNILEHKFSKLDKTNGLKNNRIRALYKDSKGTIWIGTFQGGLHAINPIDKSIRIYSTSAKEKYRISDNTVWNLCEDKDQNLWIASYNGLNKINLNTGEIEIFKYDAKPNSLSNNKVYKVLVDRSNTLWVGTFDGLNKYNPKENDFTVFKHINGDTNSLSTNRIFDIYEDTFDNLWIGTMGGGLNIFNKKTHEVKYFTEKDGLSNNVVYNILPDEEGGLWMSTNQGINHINLLNEQIRSYDLQDGLQGLEYNLGAALKDSEGNLYFGGTNGFNVFKPKEINEILQAPLTSITSIEIMGKEIMSFLQKSDTIVLSHNQNSFSLSFAALDYTSPQQNRYRYQLLNYDKDWTLASPNENKAVYNGVKPGKYAFQLYAAGYNKQWGALPLTIYIEIKPPWYQTWIFRVAFVLFFALALYLFVSLRIKRINNKHKIQQKLFELERQSLRLQMNPHFIFNTLNSIQSYVLNNKQDDSIHYLSKFSKLMRMMLTSSRENEIAIADEIKLLTYYIELERLRFNTHFDYSFNIDEEIDQEFVEIPPMLLQPYIENAIIHGLQPRKEEGGMLVIHMTLEDDFINIKIEDNGIGRIASQKKKRSSGIKHQSKGMLITKERLELLNQDVEKAFSVRIIDRVDDSGKASGTCVELLIRFDDD